VKYNFKVADYEISLMYQLLSPYIWSTLVLKTI
jgi:hypothetical protein